MSSKDRRRVAIPAIRRASGEAIDKDLLGRVEQVGLPKKLSSFSAIAVAGKGASLLNGFDRIPLRVLGGLSDAHRMREALRIRSDYKGSWGAGHQYLYRCLIRALDLWDYEPELLHLAKSKRGRKPERELSERILLLKAEGKTVPQMKAILASEGTHKSPEAIAAYLKTRRKKPTPS